MSAVVVHNAIASLVQAYAEIVGEQDARIKELQAELFRVRRETEEMREAGKKENDRLRAELNAAMRTIAVEREDRNEPQEQGP